MSSLSSILSIAANAAQVNQAAMQVVSQNVSNASTPGYSREQALFTEAPSLMTPQGTFGTGVAISDVTRVHDTLLDSIYRQQSANSSGAALSQQLLSQIQGIFNEPSDTGLSATMDAFWSSWSDLSNNPGNAASQTAVRAQGGQVAMLLNSYSRQLDGLQANATAQLTQSVQSFNALAKRVADLNQQITASEAGGHQAPALLDQRDQLIDQMTQIVPVRALPTANDGANIVIGGISVVSGSTCRALSVSGTPTAPVLTVAGNSTALTHVGGSLGSLVDFLQTELSSDSRTSVRSSLDALAQGVVNAVNAIHDTGYTASGDALGNANWDPNAGPTGSNVDFFDPSGTTASTIRLSSAVQADASVIASGTTSTGDNSVALAIASLRDASGANALSATMGAAAYTTKVGLPPNTSFGDSYNSLVTAVGTKVQSATNDATTFQTLAQNADTQRTSVSGVSVDEELTRVMQYQQGYAAAAKIVSAADQMAQDILNMVQ
ncbi:MAG TPA: flagellar hook-associated protein FlgK [Gemmatimonadaceae bacterium]|nr:flagellar hook-associated protein FlgK [Gemmatimonadaceae bacterium]